MTERTDLPSAEVEVLDWLALARVDGLPPTVALGLVERLGSAAAVLEAAPVRLAAAGLDEAQVAAVQGARRRARAELVRVRAAGAAVVPLPSPRFPVRLRAIADPPLALAVRGALAPADEVAVAIVGARRASEYGRRMAAALGRDLARAGVTVVSGLAAGIDAAAHRAALDAGGRTIAVLGTGIDVIYPSWHRELTATIAARGALVSELPCGAPPRAFHFPRRNRLISGMTLATVVVEAAERSGSLITARCALEQGREVFAVPGPADAASHRGSHRLIQEGATLVTSAEDVLGAVAPALGARLVAARAAEAEAALAPIERRVLGAVGPQGGHVDDVIRRAALPAAAALETLLALELRGLVRQLPGKRFCRQAA
ncbi:MAG TPA: DNA-processing protein DprA [Candidatus Binatia bacterium]|nr:DNA-processing protein DprA [Candidatus Binatia bacterium]